MIVIKNAKLRKILRVLVPALLIPDRKSVV